MKTKGIQRIDAVLQQVVQASPLAEGLHRQSTLEEWPTIVGDQIAAHSRPISLNDGVLTVQVDGSVWAQELSLLSPEIIAAFQGKLGAGTVREIRFRSGNL